ncbi:MAG: beta-hydroxyacyl-ACP dehydratase [Spirochaetes bacterium]|nr:beta-hydroxyacyl-ACP dehydratase [Spirochaetota bacterium]
MDYEKILRQYRKKPIARLNDLSQKLHYNQNDIKKIIPHREPFLLIDGIKAIDLEKEIIFGSRKILKDDPVFKGHFPDFAVYPGSLQLEMIGQMGLCLSYFIFKKTHIIQPDARPVNIRATKILGACFLEPVLPEREVGIVVQKLDYDGFTGKVFGQILSDQKICSISISEVCFLD